MHRSYFFGVIAITLFCLLFIIVSMWRQVSPTTTATPIAQHPVAPYSSAIAALGITEPSSGNIFIGSPINRIVSSVAVNVGDKVKKNDVLFSLEDGDLMAQFVAQEVAYEIAVAQLDRLEALPEPEDLAIAQAAVKNAKAQLQLSKEQYEMVQGLQDSRAISQEEYNRRLFTYEQAQAKWQQAHADLEKVRSGAWQPDLFIARLQTLQAKANAERAEQDLLRTVIRAPIDATVLQIKIHAGEYLPPNTTQSPIMVLGNIDEMYVRASINQFDAPFFRPEAKAVAYLQGDPSVQLSLEFVRMEPYLVSKQNLTNELTEKVDTRVLQVIYRIAKEHPPIFVGQQLDVFIEAGNR